MSTQHTPRPWLVKPVAAPMSHNGDIGIVTAKGALIAVALLTRQHWMPNGDSPESALLRDVSAAILRVEGEGA